MKRVLDTGSLEHKSKVLARPSRGKGRVATKPNGPDKRRLAAVHRKHWHAGYRRLHSILRRLEVGCQPQRLLAAIRWRATRISQDIRITGHAGVHAQQIRGATACDGVGERDQRVPVQRRRDVQQRVYGMFPSQAWCVQQQM